MHTRSKEIQISFINNGKLAHSSRIGWSQTLRSLTVPKITFIWISWFWIAIRSSTDIVMTFGTYSNVVVLSQDAVPCEPTHLTWVLRSRTTWVNWPRQTKAVLSKTTGAGKNYQLLMLSSSHFALKLFKWPVMIVKVVGLCRIYPT